MLRSTATGHDGPTLVATEEQWLREIVGMQPTIKRAPTLRSDAIREAKAALDANPTPREPTSATPSATPASVKDIEARVDSSSVEELHETCRVLILRHL